MAKANTNKSSKWRSFFVWALITLGCLMTAAFIAVNWTERVLLTTDNWVAITSPLPKDDQVAGAVAEHTVSNFFDSLDVETKVRDALPERAVFLAPTLTTALQTQSENITKKFIQSDQFQGLWESANRLAHARLIEAARSNDQAPAERTMQLGNTRFNLNLTNLRQHVASQLQRSDLGGNFADPNGQSEIVADLKLTAQNLKRFIRSTDALYAILPYVTITIFLLAIAIANRRYKALLGISIGIMIVTTLQIIGLKILRPEVINQVQNSLYRPAADVVWDSLIIPFNNMARNYFIAALSLGILTIFFGPFRATTNIRRKLKLTEIKKASVFEYVLVGRGWIGQNKKYIWIGTGVLVLIYLAFTSSLDWIQAIKIITLGISCGAVVEMLGIRTRTS